VAATVFIADDHQVVIDGLRAMLAGDPRYQVIGWTTDATQVLDRVLALRPRLLTLDLSMPQIGGLDLLKQLRATGRDVGVVVVTMFADVAHASAAFSAGANAFVSKQTDRAELSTAMREALYGRRFVGSPLTDQMLRQYERTLERGAFDPFELLSPREREVLTLVARGHRYGRIALELGISRRTVETHRDHILRKLGLRSTSALVRFALSRGLAPED
jgi:DNA-binding NarL/FixJ family response regulator